MNIFQATAWNNGKNSYGLKLSHLDRDKFFSKDFKNIHLNLPDLENCTVINIDKSSFWNNCSELIHKDIRIWLDKNHYIPWKKGSPPKFKIEKVDQICFKLLKNDTTCLSAHKKDTMRAND
jgi:hypothetical protein